MITCYLDFWRRRVTGMCDLGVFTALCYFTGVSAPARGGGDPNALLAAPVLVAGDVLQAEDLPRRDGVGVLVHHLVVDRHAGALVQAAELPRHGAPDADLRLRHRAAVRL
eukprot:580639-Pyramimonas_sp.AAC.1